MTKQDTAGLQPVGSLRDWDRADTGVRPYGNAIAVYAFVGADPCVRPVSLPEHTKLGS